MELYLFCLVFLQYEMVRSQVVRFPQSAILNRPVAETIIETPTNYISSITPTVITEPNIVPIPNSQPATTIITDCSPAICKNLADTIQLMIVCNLLQNNLGGSDIALQLVTPILNELITTTNLPCGCISNLIPNVASPSVVTSEFISPTISSIAPTVISPNVVSPRVVSSSNYGNNVLSTIGNPGLLSSLFGN